MLKDLEATVERDGELFVAFCSSIPEANGQGLTASEALEDLSQAIAFLLMCEWTENEVPSL